VGKPKTAELHPGPRVPVNHEIERPSPETVAGLGEFDTPAISDLMNRLYTMSAAIHNVTGAPPGGCSARPAPSRSTPGDNLMSTRAWTSPAPGDVVVIDAGASMMNGVLGDLISTKARHRGVQGFVVDGLIREPARHPGARGLPRLRARA
jgi:regulator of RNase E activity RraA